MFKKKCKTNKWCFTSSSRTGWLQTNIFVVRFPHEGWGLLDFWISGKALGNHSFCIAYSSTERNIFFKESEFTRFDYRFKKKKIVVNQSIYEDNFLRSSNLTNVSTDGYPQLSSEVKCWDWICWELPFSEKLIIIS